VVRQKEHFLILFKKMCSEAQTSSKAQMDETGHLGYKLCITRKADPRGKETTWSMQYPKPES
jgi:hypothetical protein